MFFSGIRLTTIVLISVSLASCSRLSALTHCDPHPPAIARTERDADLIPILGGIVEIGDNASQADEGPAFRYSAKPFLMDRTPVTVAQFAHFAAETGYVTDAERLGEAGVFDHDSDRWAPVRGATWKLPQGPGHALAESDHPVTQVSWRDATAFCGAYGSRLPTEFEWERAAHLGQTPDGHVFRAGEPILWSNQRIINIWQGYFPIYDSGADGYKSTSPVGAFGAAPSGLTDMAGNVWEWTDSWYQPYGAQNWKPNDKSERVQRGGSFLCDPGFCSGFRATARSHSTPDTSLMHVGFRCVTDPDQAPGIAGRVRSSTRVAAVAAGARKVSPSS